MEKSLNIALVSDVPPDSTYTAGQVLDKIIDNTQFANFKFYWVNQSNLPPPKFMNKRCPTAATMNLEPPFFLKKVQKLFIYSARRFPRMQRAMQTFFGAVGAVKVGLRLGLAFKKSDYDFIWMVLQGENLALTYWIIQAISNKKTILHQWDPIDWWMEHKGHGFFLKKHANLIVHQIERKATFTLVPSQQWREAQLARGANSIRVDNFFLQSEIVQNVSHRSENESEIHAVFLGQFYSNHELQKLIEVLKAAAEKSSKKLVVHYFGSFAAPTGGGVEFVNHGFLPRNELIVEISRWDLALLPYPMEARFDTTSRYSFPSKSRVYLAAGLPILSYCHLSSSPEVFYTKFFREYYHNAYHSADLQNFLNRILDKSPEAIEKRIASSTKLVMENFSSAAELVPMQDALLNFSR